MDVWELVPLFAKGIEVLKDVRKILPREKLGLSAEIKLFPVFGPEFTQVDVEVTNYSDDVIYIKTMGLIVDGEDFQFLSPSNGTGCPNLIPEFLEGHNSFDIDRIFADPSIAKAARTRGELAVYLIDGVRNLAWVEVAVSSEITQT